MNLLLTSFIHFNVAFYNCWSQAVWSRLSLRTLLNIFFVTYTTRQTRPESIHYDLWHLSVYCSISASISVALQAKKKMRRRRRNYFEKTQIVDVTSASSVFAQWVKRRVLLFNFALDCLASRESGSWNEVFLCAQKNDIQLLFIVWRPEPRFALVDRIIEMRSFVDR